MANYLYISMLLRGFLLHCLVVGDNGFPAQMHRLQIIVMIF